MSAAESRQNVAIVGGGLAGLAAVRLAEHGVGVELFAARRAELGGRATHFAIRRPAPWSITASMLP